MGKLLIGILVGLVIAAIGIYLFNSAGSDSITGATANNPNKETGELKTFVVTAGNFKFFMDGVENPEITVKQGDRVRIEFVNEEGFHDWVLDEFNARTKQLTAGNSETIEFVATTKGTFEYYCSVGEHRAMGMKGVFVVE